ncbi:hypothetical protein I6F26_19355 [Ensifer sp. IC3342]|nr:hypothetical protein [Ensifer sp. BRP08]MCA1448736.1 hypothetical protein [Ensifer sp. IC3342]
MVDDLFGSAQIVFMDGVLTVAIEFALMVVLAIEKVIMRRLTPATANAA